MSDGETAAVLWGTDHEELGVIATAPLGPNAAIANTRGRFMKAYRFEDPNEDTVAGVIGPRATLLVCADGHNGALAPNVAVQTVLDAFGADPPPELDDRAWIDLFGDVNDAVIARKGVGSEQPASNTVLLVALASPGHLSWAAIGDGAIVVGPPGAQRARQVNKEAMRFIGYPMNKRSLKSTVQRGATDLDPGEWVVVVTDGLSEFVAPLRPADVVPRVLATLDPPTAEAAARALVDTACSAGAGDNVAAAVVAP
ncbi:MAG: family protein phosphatase [Solirubrobacteraceae bacterium]|nr:family protein phosphatase [Solirubrobacteraceae bacterium]